MDLAHALSSIPAFASFNAEEVEALSRAMDVAEFPDGHVFIREGDPSRVSDAAYVLLDGQVRVTRTADSKALAKELKPGEIFGLIALVDRGERSASCIANGPVRAASLGRAAFDHLIHSNASLAWKFQRVVARQLARDWERLRETLRAALAEH